MLGKKQVDGWLSCSILQPNLAMDGHGISLGNTPFETNPTLWRSSLPETDTSLVWLQAIPNAIRFWSSSHASKMTNKLKPPCHGWCAPSFEPHQDLFLGHSGSVVVSSLCAFLWRCSKTDGGQTVKWTVQREGPRPHAGSFKLGPSGFWPHFWYFGWFWHLLQTNIDSYTIQFIDVHSIMLLWYIYIVYICTICFNHYIYIYFRRNKVFASWKLYKTSISVNCGSHFQVRFVWQVWDGQLSPSFKHINKILELLESGNATGVRQSSMLGFYGERVWRRRKEKEEEEETKHVHCGKLNKRNFCPTSVEIL